MLALTAYTVLMWRQATKKINLYRYQNSNEQNTNLFLQTVNYKMSSRTDISHTE